MFRAATAGDDCAKLEADIKARKLVAENGKTAAACITPGDKSSVTARRMSVLADRTPVPMPDYCYDLATGDGKWWYTRTDACAISVWTLRVRDIRTGQVTGELMYLQADLIYTGADAPNWAHQVVIDKTGGWGTIGGTTVSGGGDCTGDCTLAAGDKDFPSQTVTGTGLTYGDILPKTTVSAAGDIGTGRTTVTYRFANPAWTLQPALVSLRPHLSMCAATTTPRARPRSDASFRITRRST